LTLSNTYDVIQLKLLYHNTRGFHTVNAAIFGQMAITKMKQLIQFLCS